MPPGLPKILGRTLLVKKELTFVKAYEIATSMEITSKNMAVLQELKESEAVNKVTLQGDGTSEGTRRVDGRSMQYKSSCFRCGGNHSAQICRFKELKKQKGHIVNRCPNSTRSQSRGERKGPQPNKGSRRGYPGQQRSAPATAPLHPWEWPEKPWSQIHIDHAGPFMGQLFLIVINADSKWIEVYPTSSTIATATIEKLRQAFASHGLPEMVVSDNGSGFAREEFADFMAKNGILYVKTAPRHPSSKGLVERSVHIFKEGMKKLEGFVKTVYGMLSKFGIKFPGASAWKSGGKWTF
ncbi:uncharacterized protein [Montipora foliosa]|uniref:uncharacterized protein n=1 Tax=Montipora foliosa TaxID=591990 RepID=UPI0035F12356